MLEIYPWQKQQWKQLQDLKAKDRLPHALLLSGDEGLGLTHFGQCLVAALLCEQPIENGFACQECRACVLHKAGNHPDYLPLIPEEKGKQIKVDVVRELIDYVHLSSQYGKHKLALIEPAEAMNKSAANSLLKTLEEPPADSLIILISYQPALLPITIRSRCQHIKMPSVGDEEAKSWLLTQDSVNEADIESLLLLGKGKPLSALSLVETDILAQRQAILQDLEALKQKRIDVVSTAEKWQGFGISEVLQCLLMFFSEMSRQKLSQTDIDKNNSNINKDLQDLTNGLDLAQLLKCYDFALKSYHSVSGPISLNKQSLLEEIIIEWQSITGPGR